MFSSKAPIRQETVNPPNHVDPVKNQMHNNYSILLTIDVEDWFQVENFKQWIPFSSWSSYELRVEKNTHRILDLLDSKQSAVSDQRSVPINSTNPSDSPRQKRVEISRFHQETEKEKKSSKSCLTTPSPKATFFVLGWIAERLPNLVREIQDRGHEVASHGYYHNLCNEEPPDALKKDLSASKKLLEDITGTPVYGYRAPSFSINSNILETISECGYLYDSSFNSFAMHGRYGRVDLSQNRTRGIAVQIPNPRSQTNLTDSTSLRQRRIDFSAFHPERQKPKDTKSEKSCQSCLTRGHHNQSSILYELPVSNLELGSRVFPWGGGAYFRLIPLPLFKLGVQSILKHKRAYLFYVHPWEIDPQQPRVDHASTSFKFRHYVNLDRTLSKLSTFFGAFSNCHFLTCCQYLQEVSATDGLPLQAE